MKWTTDKPSEPGWYWQRRIEKTDWDMKYAHMTCIRHRTEVVKIREYSGALAQGNSTFNGVWEYAYEWSGPIPEPTD